MTKPAAKQILTLMAIIGLSSLPACGGGSASNPRGQDTSPTSTDTPASSFRDMTPASTNPITPMYAAAAKAQAISRVNDHRATVGQDYLAQNAQLEQTAQAHSEYMYFNAECSHSENPLKEGFTGTSVCTHAATAGFPGPASEVHAGLLSDATESSCTFLANDLFGATYHRNLLLSFTADNMGLDFRNNGAPGTLRGLTINLSRNPGQGAPNLTANLPEQHLLRPKTGTTVSTVGGPELLDPYQELNGAPHFYQVSIHPHANKVLAVTSFTLTDTMTNLPVIAALLQRSNDINMPSNTKSIIARDPPSTDGSTPHASLERREAQPST